MSEALPSREALLEVVSPDGSRRSVRVTESPFTIGRVGEIANHLPLDDRLISRQCAAIVCDNGHYLLQDRGNRHGLFLNGEKIDKQIWKRATPLASV